MPFRWPNTCQKVMHATEVEFAKVQEKQKRVVLSERACRERMNGLICILKYLEEVKKAIKRWACGNI